MSRRAELAEATVSSLRSELEQKQREIISQLSPIGSPMSPALGEKGVRLLAQVQEYQVNCVQQLQLDYEASAGSYY